MLPDIVIGSGMKSCICSGWICFFISSSERLRESSRVATDVGNADTVAGGVAGAMELGNTANAIKGKLTAPSELETATAQRATAAQQGVSAFNDINKQVSDYKTNLGNNFQQGAANIEKTNPGSILKVDTPTSLEISSLKNNKSFALPSGFNVSNLTPTSAQDLITQLNNATFRETAAGFVGYGRRLGVTRSTIREWYKYYFPEEYRQHVE